MPFVTNDGHHQFIISSQGQFNGYVYICSIDEERPIKAIPINAGVHVTFMQIFAKTDGDMIIIGYENGEVQLICNFNFDKRMSVKYHDAQIGSITGAVFNNDQTFFITVAQDGLTFVHQFDKVATMEECQFNPLDGVEGIMFMPESEKIALAEKNLKNYQNEKQPVFQ